MHRTWELLLAVAPKVAQLGNAWSGAQWRCTTSAGLRPPLLLHFQVSSGTNRTDPLLRSAAFTQQLLILSWFIWRGKVGRAPPASCSWRPRWRTGSEQGAGRWEGERSCFSSCLQDCFACVELPCRWQGRSPDLEIKGGNHKSGLYNLFLGTSHFGVGGCCKWMRVNGRVRCPDKAYVALMFRQCSF